MKNSTRKIFRHLYKYRWVHIFIRDLILVFIVAVLHYYTHFNSKTVFLITGMLMVWITWQLNDYLNYKKSLNGIA